METNESVKNVMNEEQQVMHPYFSEYTPIETREVKSRFPDNCEQIFSECGMGCILF